MPDFSSEFIFQYVNKLSHETVDIDLSRMNNEEIFTVLHSQTVEYNKVGDSMVVESYEDVYAQPCHSPGRINVLQLSLSKSHLLVFPRIPAGITTTTRLLPPTTTAAHLLLTNLWTRLRGLTN